jgi:UDP-glucose 4-epimerase
LLQADVRDEAALNRIFAAAPISAVIHFAALKAVGESISKPIEYYDNNVGGLLVVLRTMRAAGVKQLVFSSSATVYGTAKSPFTEDSPVGAGITNPYGQTKCMAETILADVHRATPDWGIIALRYFNPVGAHPR